MNKRITIILIITSILILLGINSVFAASGEFSLNKNSATIEIGETTTFSITATNCGGKFVITSSNTSVATVSSSNEWIENASKEVTITAKAAGTAKITITADDVASTDEEVVTGSKTITITVPEKKVEENINKGEGNSANNNTQTPSTNTNTNTNTSSGKDNSTSTTKPVETQKPAETPKSSEARLKNLGIKPNDFSGFKKDKTEYSIEVPSDIESVEVYAEPVDSKAKISGDGKVSLNEGNNKIGVKVTAEDGKTTKTYIINIKRKTAIEEDEENGENRLKSLGIKPEEYDFLGFDSEKTEYTAEVPNEVEQIEIVATANDSKAQITGIGMIDLEEGENELKIEVIAVNGDKKTYTLTVTRKEAEKKEQFGLSTLSITGLKLNPSFKVEIYEYNVDLKEDLTSLEIKAKANTEDATVEIVGNENLQQGENTITILVKNEETEENATYQIIVNKNVVVVAEIVEKTSWLKPSTWGKEEKIKITIIIVLIILIICAVILKIKISKGNPKALKVDLPGADELDRAIAEHQELVEEENFVNKFNNSDLKSLEDRNVAEQNYLEEIAQNRLEDFEYQVDDKPKRRGRHF